MNNNEITASGDELRVILETGFILREAARFDDAETVFRGCIELMPESEVPMVGLGTVFLQKGDFNSALDNCKLALELNPASSYARVHYAEALLFQNNREQAVIELEKIIETEPNSSYAQTAQSLLNAADIISSN